MRVYCPPEHIRANHVTIIEKDQIHHLAVVLRLKKGQKIVVFDGTKEYLCEAQEVSKNKITARIIDVRKRPQDSKMLPLAVACAIPKKAKLDYIIEKCTELGVTRIIPLITERTIVRIEGSAAGGKQKRWQRIAREAAKQCQRVDYPVVEPPMPFEQALSYVHEYAVALIPNLGQDTRHIKELRDIVRGKSAIIFIGPEGDFSPQELQKAKDAGCTGVSLGDLVLKVDTAAIAIVSYIHLNL